MRFRLTVTVAIEYEVNPSDYPEGSTVEDILRIDHEAISDNPDIMMDYMMDHLDPEWKIQLNDITPQYKGN